MLQSFGNLPKVPANVQRLNQEIEQASHAYNNVVRKLAEVLSAEGIAMPAPEVLVSRLGDG